MIKKYLKLMGYKNSKSVYLKFVHFYRWMDIFNIILSITLFKFIHILNNAICTATLRKF